MSKQKPTFPGIESLTQSGIASWAGEKIASRGRDYQRNGSVRDLCITADGALLADVQGSELYSVAVVSGEDNRPESSCSCPYGDDCKHGVAALLEYLERLNKGKSVKMADSDDPRLDLLDMDEEYRQEEPAKKSGKNSKPSTSDKKADNKISIESYLAELSKKQLIAKIMRLAKDMPKVKAALQEEALGHKGDNAKLLTNLRKEIQRVSQMEAWTDSWSGHGEIPDYSGVRQKMRILLDNGCFDALLDEGLVLLELGTEQVETSHDEGETAEEIADCIPLLVEALRGSMRPEEEKILWALDAVLEDEFGICDGLVDFLREKHPPETWSLAVDSLSKKLQKLSPLKERYQRGFVGDWLIHALEGADRGPEILPFCVAEAEAMGNYQRLVNILIGDGKDAEALEWIQKVIGKVEENSPGSAESLRNSQRKIYTRQKDWQALTLLEAEDFIRGPSTEKFTQCRAAAEKIKIWPDLRETLLDFPVSGKIPWEHAKWPPALPKPQTQANIKHGKKDFPMLRLLTSIAMEEKIPEDVVRWYAVLPERQMDDFFDDKVALAVQEKFPEQSIKIWKRLAETAVARTTKNAYAEAGGYLRKMREVMHANGLQKDWLEYAASLRVQHKKKRLFLEVLDSMNEKPILRR